MPFVDNFFNVATSSLVVVAHLLQVFILNVVLMFKCIAHNIGN